MASNADSIENEDKRKTFDFEDIIGITYGKVSDVF